MKLLVDESLLFIQVILMCKIYSTFGDDEVLKIVSQMGYEGKFHQVLTEDGYILGVHQIAAKRKNLVKNPVFIMHGFLTTPMSFFLTSRENTLPFLLADNDYDVFMGSRRGSKFSSQHTNFSKFSQDYWNFDWHEIGHYDLPAMIDLALNLTNTSKCFFIGYSQGNTELLVLLSTRPEYNEKIIQAHMLSCAGALPNIHEIGRVLAPLLLNYATMHKDFAFVKMTSIWNLAMELAEILCKSKTQIRVEICKNIIYSIVGRNKRSTEIDPRIYKPMFKNLSPYVGVKQFLHYSQTIQSGEFRAYDYGAEGNLVIYNSTIPEKYNLSLAKVPIYIFVGEEDIIFNPKVSIELA